MDSDQVRTYDCASSIVFLKTTESFGGLSNMARGFPLCVNGIDIRTSEALYQACRFPHMPNIQRLIIEQRSPMTAKMKSKPHRNNSRPDWNQVRVNIMRWCLRVKLAQNWQKFSRLLLESGNHPIVEQSRNDDFWGAKPAENNTLVGMNVLGRLLMELRQEIIREEEALLFLEPINIPDFCLYGQEITAISAELAVAESPVPFAIRQQNILFNFLQEKKDSSHLEDMGSGVVLKSYLAMKDSGVKWLGKVPEHWEVRRGKLLFRHRKQINADGGETNVLSLTLRGVVNNDPENPEGLVPKDYATYQLFRKGDLVFKLIDLENLQTSRVGLVHEDGIMSSAYVRLTPKVSLDIHFFYQQYFDLYLRGIYNQLGAGVRSTLGPYDLLELRVLLPPFPEQAKIVRYLDYVGRRVRQFVKAKQKLIGLLEEQKQAIIHRAVTRGLDPDVPLKDSGVEWLGEIPEHWEVAPFKRIGWFSSGDGFPITHQGKVDKDILFVKVSDMNRLGNERSIASSENTVSQAMAKDLGAYIFQRYTIIFPKVGGALLTNKRRILSREACIDNNLMGFVVTECDVNFVFCILLSLDFGKLAKPGPVPSIGERDVREIRVALPPISEQAAIVKYLDKITANIDVVITQTYREIALLQEYHTRLTADVVTGKVDVRDAAANLPDEARAPASLCRSDVPETKTDSTVEESRT